MKQENKQQKPQQAQAQTPQPQLDERRMKTVEQFKRKAQENKKRWMPLVRFLKKHKLKFKLARCGKVRVEYFRTDQLQKLLQDNKEEIQKNQDLKTLSSSWQKEVVFFQRPQNIPKLKYPQQLQKPEGNSKTKFASFKFDTAEPKTWLFPAILFGIIAVVLFPLWPYTLKYGIFIVSLYLVIAIVGVIILRLVVYLLFAIFGVSFWILPNFFADCTILESFIPVFSVKKWETGLFSIIGRLIALSIFSYYAYHLYIDPSWVFENIQITKQSVDDLHDWGVSKIKGQKNFSQSALTNLQDIMNQTAQADISDSIQLDEPTMFEQQNQNQPNEKDDTEEQNNQSRQQQQSFSAGTQPQKVEEL